MKSTTHILYFFSSLNIICFRKLTALEFVWGLINKYCYFIRVKIPKNTPLARVLEKNYKNVKL